MLVHLPSQNLGAVRLFVIPLVFQWGAAPLGEKDLSRILHVTVNAAPRKAGMAEVLALP